MEDILILDNSPISYLFQKQNALPIKTWLDDRNDIELYKYLRLLEYLAKVDDVRKVISRIVDQEKNQIDFEVFDDIVNSKNNIDDERRQFYSESRKMFAPRFGYVSMLEPSALAQKRVGSNDRKAHIHANANFTPKQKNQIKPRLSKKFDVSNKKVRH